MVEVYGRQRFCISGEEAIARIGERYPLEPVDKGAFAGPSVDYRIPGASGTIGVITAVSGHFCNDCNRIRVTSRGQAKGCLFSDEKTDLMPFLRPPDREALTRTLHEIVKTKPEGHGIKCGRYEHSNFSMSHVGG